MRTFRNGIQSRSNMKYATNMNAAAAAAFMNSMLLGEKFYQRGLAKQIRRGYTVTGVNYHTQRTVTVSWVRAHGGGFTLIVT